MHELLLDFSETSRIKVKPDDLILPRRKLPSELLIKDVSDEYKEQCELCKHWFWENELTTFKGKKVCDRCKAKWVKNLNRIKRF